MQVPDELKTEHWLKERIREGEALYQEADALQLRGRHLQTRARMVYVGAAAFTAVLLLFRGPTGYFRVVSEVTGWDAGHLFWLVLPLVMLAACAITFLYQIHFLFTVRRFDRKMVLYRVVNPPQGA